MSVSDWCTRQACIIQRLVLLDIGIAVPSGTSSVLTNAVHAEKNDHECGAEEDSSGETYTFVNMQSHAKMRKAIAMLCPLM